MDVEMDKDERKRVERLQEDGPKGVKGGWSLEKLTYPDLQLLLIADPTIQDLIRQIVESMLAAPEEEDTTDAVESASDASEQDETEAEPPAKLKKVKSKASAALNTRHASLNIAPPPPPAPVIKIERVIEKVPYEVRVEVPVQDPLRGQLAPELALLKAVKADAELAQAWLWADESEGRQLVRLLAVLSEWDEVLRLWSCLADRCKNGQRAATPAELHLLQAALALHNLRWRDRSARLVRADSGVPFHHESMERGPSKGNTVAGVWLPGLENAAGQAQKKPLVDLH